jgi:type II secretory pathway component GspD/PulD (secretin)
MEMDDSAIKDLGINWQVLQGYSAGIGNMNWQLNERREWGRTQNDSVRQWDNRSSLDEINQRFDIDGQPYEESTTTYEEQPPESGNWVGQTRITPTRELRDGIDRDKDIQSQAGDTFTRTITDLRSAILGADDFSIVLSALQQINGVSVVSNPKIIVSNEEDAIIHIGQTERPFDAELIPATETADARVIYRPGAPVDFGVKLTVTPTVNTMSNITVRIAPELTRFVRDDFAPDGRTRYPIVATKTIRTMFCLESGKTVAIGGLTETEDRDVVKKIPLLGDIPILGKYLFSHKSTKRSQKETVIFVTVGLARPNHIEKTDGFPEDTELTHREIMRSALRRQQFAAEQQKLKEDLAKGDAAARSRALRKK